MDTPTLRSGILRRVLAALALAAVASAARAADPPPSEAFAAFSEDTGRAAAAKLWAAADEARKARLFRDARREAARVLAEDPDHAGARALLGFVRDGDRWREDAALAAKTPPDNFGGARVALDDAVAAERRWWRDVRPAAVAAAAGAWASLGEELAKLGDAAGAASAHRRALRLDPDSERSRKAVGEVRWHGVWLKHDDVRAVEAACAARVVDRESPYDAAFGVRLVKVETPHFRVEGRIPAARLAEIARWLEIAYAVQLVEVGRAPTANVFQRPVTFVLCDTASDWTAWIDRFVTQDREFHRPRNGAWADAWRYGYRAPDDADDVTRRDHLLHRVVHCVNLHALGLAWPLSLDEGLCHATAVRLQDTTRTWCVTPTRSDYAAAGTAPGAEGWLQQRDWRAAIRARVAARDDLALRLVISKPMPELGFAGALKAWSVLDAWRAEDPDALRALLPKLRGAKDPAAVVEEHFGRPLEALDEAWRRYVLRTY